MISVGYERHNCSRGLSGAEEGADHPGSCFPLPLGQGASSSLSYLGPTLTHFPSDDDNSLPSVRGLLLLPLLLLPAIPLYPFTVVFELLIIQTHPRHGLPRVLELPHSYDEEAEDGRGSSLCSPVQSLWLRGIKPHDVSLEQPPLLFSVALFLLFCYHSTFSFPLTYSFFPSLILCQLIFPCVSFNLCSVLPLFPSFTIFSSPHPSIYLVTLCSAVLLFP